MPKNWPKARHIVVVNRGNMQCTIPMDTWLLATTSGAELATVAVHTIARLQAAYAGDRPDKPLDPNSHVPLVLKFAERDNALSPTAMCLDQFEGMWQEMDLDKSGFANEYTGNAPYVELELVESITAL